MNDPRSNEFTHPEGNEEMNPQTPRSCSSANEVPPIVERVRFDIIAHHRQNKLEYRCWTEGFFVHWTACDSDGVQFERGHMPIDLFRLAALTLARRCEEEAIGQGDGEQADNFFNMVHDSLRTPIETAMAHPFWAQPDHPANDLRLRFDSHAIDTTLDSTPMALRPRAMSARDGGAQ